MEVELVNGTLESFTVENGEKENVSVNGMTDIVFVVMAVIVIIACWKLLKKWY